MVAVPSLFIIANALTWPITRAAAMVNCVLEGAYPGTCNHFHRQVVAIQIRSGLSSSST